MACRRLHRRRGCTCALSWLLLDDRRDVVPEWEADVFGAVNGLPDSLRWPLWVPMQLGNFWMCAAGAVGVYARPPGASALRSPRPAPSSWRGAQPRS